MDDAVAQLRALTVDADLTGDTFYANCVRHNLAEALLGAGKPQEARQVAESCTPHHHGGDDLLVRAKRAALIARCNEACGEISPQDVVLEAALLERTTKPQAWLYRRPWYLCDIEFWED